MNYRIKILTFLKRLAFILLLFVIMRNLMYVFNTNIFNISFIELLKINFYGLRFDIATVVGSNGILLILYLLPFKFSYTKVYNYLLNFVYIIINSLSIIANLSDIIYYRFTLKRTTFEFVQMFKEDDNMFGLINSFIFDFWYISLIGILMIIALIWFTIYSSKDVSRYKQSMFFFSFNIKRILISTIILIASIIATRGGFQLRPISIIDASKYVSSNEQALVLNTTLSILKTIDKQSIKPKEYFSDKELQSIINPIHKAEENAEFRKLNIVIIIMESMSKEHSAYFNSNLKGKTFTPFLDSLCTQSLVCKQAYANGRKSIEGVPAILASYPTLFNDAFISSNYSANKINSFASLLGKMDYGSYFYHGGNNGTMGFDNFTASIGFDKYYGRKEYNNEDDFDGKWGIFDHKFFEYFKNELSKKQQPFFASIFSLSAHHPYTIPEEFKGKFPEGKIPIQQCIAYSDFALQEFFRNAKKAQWYKNTLFIITADHTSEVADNDFNNAAGRYAIPILYFMPADDSLKGSFEATTQQIDIMPSVLDYLNFPKDYYSLGNSIFNDSTNQYNESISYSNGIHQYISGNEIIQFNSIDNSIILQQKISRKLQANTSNNYDKTKRLWAIIQRYNQDMVDDGMRIK